MILIRKIVINLSEKLAEIKGLNARVKIADNETDLKVILVLPKPLRSKFCKNKSSHIATQNLNTTQTFNTR